MNWPTLLNYATIGFVLLGLYWVVRLLWLPRHTGGLPRCAQCGYATIGLPLPRCPECGAALDEENAVGRTRFRVRSWALAALGWAALVLAAAVAADYYLLSVSRTTWMGRIERSGGYALSGPWEQPWTQVEVSVLEHHLWRPRAADYEARLVCELPPLTNGRTVQLDERDVLVVWPAGRVPPAAIDNEVVKWHARHAGTLEPGEGARMGQIAVAYKDWVLAGGSSPLPGAGQPPGGFCIADDFCAMRRPLARGLIQDVSALLFAALWCAGAWYIYRAAWRRAGVFAVEDLADIPAAAMAAPGVGPTDPGAPSATEAPASSPGDRSGGMP